MIVDLLLLFRSWYGICSIREYVTIPKLELQKESTQAKEYKETPAFDMDMV